MSHDEIDGRNGVLSLAALCSKALGIRGGFSLPILPSASSCDDRTDAFSWWLGEPLGPLLSSQGRCVAGQVCVVLGGGHSLSVPYFYFSSPPLLTPSTTPFHFPLSVSVSAISSPRRPRAPRNALKRHLSYFEPQQEAQSCSLAPQVKGIKKTLGSQLNQPEASLPPASLLPVHDRVFILSQRTVMLQG